MKNKLAVLGFCALLGLGIAGLAFMPPQGNKQKNEQGQGKSNQGNKGNKGNKNDQGNKDNPGNKGNQGNPGQGNKDNPGNSGNQGNRGNNGKDNRPEGTDPGEKGNKVKTRDDGRFIWDRETFKDRRKHRNNEKITICHKPNRGGDGEPGVTLSVSSNAWKAHQGHGDVMGACPEVNNGRFSDIFMRRRNDYFGTIVNGQEQVIYSQSILDYALERLLASRQQLDRYRSSGMPADELREKEAAVAELEQNTSLLETLVTAASVLIAERL